MFHKVNARDVHPQFPRHLRRGPFFQDGAIENLVMLRIKSPLQTMQRRIEQMPLPFFLPDGADIDRVGKTFDRRRIPMRLIRCLTPELIRRVRVSGIDRRSANA